MNSTPQLFIHKCFFFLRDFEDSLQQERNINLFCFRCDELFNFFYMFPNISIAREHFEHLKTYLVQAPISGPIMEGFGQLLAFSLVMLFGSYAAGSLPLFMTMSEKNLHLVQIL